MGIFLDNGFLDFRYCLRTGVPHVFILGGRGTGKTYGALKYLVEERRPFVLLRRTQASLDIINKPEFSPINPVAKDLGLQITTESVSKYSAGFFLEEAGQRQELGITAALSTFARQRGFGQIGELWRVLLYDEFIPERHEKTIGGGDGSIEAGAYFNVYESIDRNRQLQGEPPLQAVLLANANRLASPIMMELGLVPVLERMEKKHQVEYINPERGVAIYNLWNSPISQQKQETALYKLTEGTSFHDMAISNQFAFDDKSDVKSLPLQGMKLRLQLGPFFIYAANGFTYISGHGAGTPSKVYQDTEIDKRRFVKDHPTMLSRILRHKVKYESFEAKAYLTSLYI